MKNITLVLTSYDVRRIAAIMKKEKTTAIVLRGEASCHPEASSSPMRKVYFHNRDGSAIHHV